MYPYISVSVWKIFRKINCTLFFLFFFSLRLVEKFRSQLKVLQHYQQSIQSLYPKKQLQEKKKPQICFELLAAGLSGESARRQYRLHQMAHQFWLLWSVGGWGHHSVVMRGGLRWRGGRYSDGDPGTETSQVPDRWVLKFCYISKTLSCLESERISHFQVAS